MSVIEHRDNVRRLDNHQAQSRAERAAQLVARYEPLVQSVASVCSIDRVLARAVAQEALLAVLIMPEKERTNARVIEVTRNIATENAIRFAAYCQ